MEVRTEYGQNDEKATYCDEIIGFTEKYLGSVPEKVEPGSVRLHKKHREIPGK